METGLEALRGESVAQQRKLYVALELSDAKWRMVLSDGQRRSEHVVAGGDGQAVLERIERARARFGLPVGVEVVSCYEAGRDGFWLHRWLEGHGVRSLVVDSSSIEVNRRARRAKTDRLDAGKLLGLLLRYGAGEQRVWSVLRVPTLEQEDARRGFRERDRLKQERGAHRGRIKSLLVLHNLRLGRLGGAAWERRLKELAVPECLRAELVREAERLGLVEAQLRGIEAEQARACAARAPAQTPQSRQMGALRRLAGIDLIGAWGLVRELLGWRRFRNRRELAASVGLVPSPYNSGDSEREQGISKAGNGRLRALLVELAWSWLRYQSESALAQWYGRRFAHGGKRLRRIGIVALARRLLIALWRYVEHGVIPEGAKLKSA